MADIVKTTLGPKGMVCAVTLMNTDDPQDKILQPMGDRGEIQVTNDGATILKSLYVDNAAAKIIIEISKGQDDEVGDGTTSVVVFAGELLREADKLTAQQKMHPQIIIEGMDEHWLGETHSIGWREASIVALKALEDSAIDNSADPGALYPSNIAHARFRGLQKGSVQHRQNHVKLKGSWPRLQRFFRQFGRRCCIEVEGQHELGYDTCYQEDRRYFVRVFLGRGFHS